MDHRLYVTTLSKFDSRKREEKPDKLGTATQCMVLGTGDNVLCHLEEVEYLQQSGQPGCIVFLDFSKAYDRLSRSWVQKCMSSMGFGQNACKVVVARRRVRLPSGVLFLGEKFGVSLVDLANVFDSVTCKHPDLTTVVSVRPFFDCGAQQLGNTGRNGASRGLHLVISRIFKS
ncbi:hypothetical protein ABBQ38_011580 [Trebouxia sp. C0009 RCD-2024]